MLLKTFKFYGRESTFTEFETFSGKDTLKVKSSDRLIALTKKQLQMLADKMPNLKSAEYTSIRQINSTPYTMPEFVLAETYLIDAFDFLFANMKDENWAKDHIKALDEDANSKLASYSFEGHYHGKLVHLDLTVVFAETDEFPKTTLFNGVDDDEIAVKSDKEVLEEVNSFLNMMKKGWVWWETERRDCAIYLRALATPMVFGQDFGS